MKRKKQSELTSSITQFIFVICIFSLFICLNCNSQELPTESDWFFYGSFETIGPPTFSNFGLAQVRNSMIEEIYGVPEHVLDVLIDGSKMWIGSNSGLSWFEIDVNNNINFGGNIGGEIGDGQEVTSVGCLVNGKESSTSIYVCSNGKLAKWTSSGWISPNPSQSVSGVQTIFKFNSNIWVGGTFSSSNQQNILFPISVQDMIISPYSSFSFPFFFLKKKKKYIQFFSNSFLIRPSTSNSSFVFPDGNQGLITLDFGITSTLSEIWLVNSKFEQRGTKTFSITLNGNNSTESLRYYDGVSFYFHYFLFSFFFFL